VSRKKNKSNKNKITTSIKTIPEILYKYVPLESVEPILTNSSLKFTNPLEFNDPFDCNMPSFDIGLVDYKKLMSEEMSKALGIDPRSKEFNQIIASSASEFKNLREHIQKDAKLMLSDWDTLISDYRILSLTTTPNNILMWSHYAKDHKGVVLGFKANSSFGEAGKVNYDKGKVLLGKFLESMSRVLIQSVMKGDNSDSLTDFAGTKTVNVLFNYFFLKKEEWSYENEYRVLLPANNDKIINHNSMDLVQFHNNDLKSVTFGVATPDETIEEITGLVLDKYKHVSIHKAYKDGWDLKI
jgi:hypothetical protein